MISRLLLAGMIVAASGAAAAPAPKGGDVPLYFPTVVGDKWAWEAAKGTTRYRVVGEEDVEVPAGKFRSVRVEEERTDGKSHSEVWWATRVGLVKQVFDVGDNTQQVQVLKSFTPAGK